MSILEAIILGIVQGVTEFLPVSSSGHLVLLQQLFGAKGDLLFFDTVLHIGTLIAVLIAFFPGLSAIIKKPFQKMTGLLFLATIPLVFATLLLHDEMDAMFKGIYLSYGFFLTALLLLLSERINKFSQKKKNLSVLASFCIGCIQTLSLFPGVSRSGSTISGGFLLGIEREKAANFSFLLSVPVILGSVVYQGYEIIKAPALFDPSLLFPAFVGMVFSGIFGYLSIRFLLALIRKKNLYAFSFYTFLLGMLVLADQLFFHLAF